MWSSGLYSLGRILRLYTNLQNLQISYINLKFMKSVSPTLVKKEVLCLGMARGGTESSSPSFLCSSIRCLIPDLECRGGGERLVHSSCSFNTSLLCWVPKEYQLLPVVCCFCNVDLCPLRIGLSPQNHLIEPVGKSSWWWWLFHHFHNCGIWNRYLDLMYFITWVIQLPNFSFVFGEDMSGQELSLLILIK